jgi:hypothetical protein
MPAFKDLTGQTFGRLNVVAQTANIGGKTAWRCACTCGGIKEVRGDALQSGNTQSCGCLWDEAIIKHGDYQDPVHAVWRAMRARCSNPKNPKWMRYGGRGIKVDPRWDSYSAFLLDMGPRPDGYTLERLDNDGDYTPVNCVWANRSQQCRNSSQTRLITLGGHTRSATEWAELTKINVRTILWRINRGWPPEFALTLPKYASLPDGVNLTLTAAPTPPD